MEIQRLKTTTNEKQHKKEKKINLPHHPIPQRVILLVLVLQKQLKRKNPKRRKPQTVTIRQPIPKH